MRTEWQYISVYLGVGAEIMSTLNSYGKDGWELVHLTPQGDWMILKRAVE